MKASNALSLKIGSLVHCHATNNQGILVEAPYLNDQSQVVLCCASWDQIRDTDWKNFSEDELKYLFVVDFATHHDSSTHVGCNHVFDYVFDQDLHEFSVRAAEVFQSMNWKYYNHETNEYYVPNKVQIHDKAYELAERSYEQYCSQGNGFVYPECRILVCKNSSAFYFGICP